MAVNKLIFGIIVGQKIVTVPGVGCQVEVYMDLIGASVGIEQEFSWLRPCSG